VNDIKAAPEYAIGGRDSRASATFSANTDTRKTIESPFDIVTGWFDTLAVSFETATAWARLPIQALSKLIS
jgi:hypothetical protein